MLDRGVYTAVCTVEFGSVWCWLASMTIFGAVAEPYLVAWSLVWKGDDGRLMAADWTSQWLVLVPRAGEADQRTRSWKTAVAEAILDAIPGPSLCVRGE